MQEVTLTEILSAREARAARQAELLREHGLPLVSFSLNIPGPVKDSPLIRRSFHAGVDELEAALASAKFPAIHREEQLAPTGCEALFSVEGDPKAIKRLCVGIEDASPLGRLFDLDVLEAPDGEKLSREDNGSTPRSCLVCGKPGRGCASRRLHSVEELQGAVRRIMEEYFLVADRKTIAFLATKCLLDEACTTPKPGLVDCANSGSHKDMDRFTLMASAAALQPYWDACMQIGQDTAEKAPSVTFEALRKEGQAAERRMFAATHGINTHKGAIFTLGTLCGAIGRLWKADAPCRNVDAILAECSRLSSAAVQSDFASLSEGQTARTAGERLYLQCGLRGSRGELAAGLPSIRETALPIFRSALERGCSRNDAGAIALLHLIAQGKDTNLVARGGPKGAQDAVDEVRALLQETPLPSMDRITELDHSFIRRNLSPGGCADLLAVTYFLHDWGTAG